MHILNGLIRVQRIGIQAPIHDTIFTYCRTISITTDDNNGKSTIPENHDEKHYYYRYSIPRQLSYSSHASSFLGSADSSTILAIDLTLLLVVAE